jgi:uncharacterized protein
MYKIALIFVPSVIMVVWSVLGEVLLKSVSDLYMKTLILAVTGILGGICLFLIIKFFSRKTNIGPTNIGSWSSLLFGCFAGLVISLTSGYLFYATKQPATDFTKYSNKIGPRFIGNVSPAIIEEIAFRGGVVHAVTSFWGKGLGLLSGSVPFGLIHLVGRLLGKPIGLWHVIGVTSAGLLLSIAYLRFGLLFVIGVHWIWNSLCGVWVSIFELPRNGGVQIIEGAWTTVLVLLVGTTIIYFFPPRAVPMIVRKK